MSTPGMRAESPAHRIAWKAVAKSELLEHRACTLQAEPFLGNGAVASEVSVVRLADVIQVNPGKTEARSLPPETEVSFVPMEDLPTDRPDFVPTRTRPIGEVITGYTCFRDRDVLLAKITPCFENGKAGIAAGLKNGIGFGSTEFYVLRASDKILPEFLYHIVKRETFRDEGAENMAGTAGQQRVRRDFIEDYEIPLPPLEEQRRIVAEIEGYQKVLDGARQILAGYKPKLDLDPEWESVKLADVTDANCSLSYGIVQPGDEFPGGLPIVRPVDLTTNVIRLDGLKRINPKLADGYKRSTLQGGELLLCVRGTTGVVSIAAPELAGANVTRGIVPVRFNSSVMLPQFGFYAICSESVQNQIRAKTYGAALQQINIGDLRELSLPLPPLEEQRRLVAELDAEAAQMEAVRSLIPRFEAKIQHVLARVWGNPPEAVP